MSEEKSLFEQMGGTYIERDGLLYPRLLQDQEAAKVNEEARDKIVEEDYYILTLAAGGNLIAFPLITPEQPEPEAVEEEELEPEENEFQTEDGKNRG